MSFSHQDAGLFVQLDPLVTVAVIMLTYFWGQALLRAFPRLSHFCLPAAIVGGISIASINMLTHNFLGVTFLFDSSLQIPTMTGFFTCLGFMAASGNSSKVASGTYTFFFLSVLLILAQNLISISVAAVFNLDLALGITAGSASLVGGHGTVIPFAAILEERGVANAMNAALASATYGLVAASLLGGPLATHLIRRRNITGNSINTRLITTKSDTEEKPLHIISNKLLKSLGLVLVTMGMSSLIASIATGLIPDIVVPASVASMILGLCFGFIIKKNPTNPIIRSLEFSLPEINLIGNIMLIFFLTLSAISLQLWELLSLALPLASMLLLNTLFIALYAYFIVFPLMAKALASEYEGVVVLSGLIGFGLGAAPNAMANMDAISAKFGAAPIAYLVLPLVGNFLVDLINVPLVFILVNLLS